MACTPLDIQTGLFLTASNWLSEPTASFDGKTLTLTTSDPNPGILVQQGSNSVFHPRLANRSLSYTVLGNKFLLILDVETGVGSSTRRISLVNFATWTEVPILTVVASSSAVALPIANASPGNGSVFLAFGQDGTQHTSVAIYRSDNGAVLCSLGPPIIPTGQTAGEATATELIIHYSTGGTSKQQKCPKPAGVCQVTPSSQTFPDVFVGGCPFTPPTRQFTIKNIGEDCLTINPISDNAPFSVQSTSAPLSALLAKDETLSVTVAFNPTVAGNFSSVALALNTSPANGDDQLVCTGKALAAEFKIQFSATTLNFGTVPANSTVVNQTLTITNNGSKPLPVSIAPISVSGFACAGFNGTLNCGQSQPIGVSFTPGSSEGTFAASLSVASSAPGSPHTINLTAKVCIANAEISVPAPEPLNFGSIQQGFRTVRKFTVKNTGDGPLTFTGAVTGPDAALFGLPDPAGSVTNAPLIRAYSVDPVTPCGPLAAGTGETVVAVSFYAGEVPSTTPRTATLTLSGHNATNVPATQTWVFPLSAVIDPPVALDIALVVDRSGSMTDSLGSRVKMDAAIAASQLFAELLRADLDDRVSVVRFNEMPEVVVAMTPVTATGSPSQQQVLQQIQTGITPATGFTAIAGGALVGVKEVQSPRPTPPAELTRAVIVLSDGIENRAFEDPPGSDNWFSILGGPMRKPQSPNPFVPTTAMPDPLDIKVYAVGLGHDGELDEEQLEALATDSTTYLRVNQDLTGDKYFELEKYYTQIFMDAVDMATIKDPMFWITPGEKHEIQFDVLGGDVGALIVVYDFEGMRLPFYCISPQGEIVDPAMIPGGFQLRSGVTAQVRFVEFKMPMGESDRYAGAWRVVVEHPGEVCLGAPNPKGDRPGFLPRECRPFKDPILYGIAIGVGSNFRMMPFVTPGPVYAGEPILLTALVSEAGLPVPGCTVTVEATGPAGGGWSLTLPDDGAHSDGDADDGEYARSFTQTHVAGTYHFLFRAVGFSRDGEPVVREAFRDRPVLPRKRPPPCEKVDDRHPDDSPEDGGSGGKKRWEQLLEELRQQRGLLERLLKRRK